MANTTTFIEGTNTLVAATAERLSGTKGTLVREVIIETDTASQYVRMGATSSVSATTGVYLFGPIADVTAGDQEIISAENAAERGTHGIGSGQSRIDLYDIWVISAGTPTLTWFGIT